MNRFLMMFAAVSLFGCDPGPAPGETPPPECPSEFQPVTVGWEGGAAVRAAAGGRVELAGTVMSPGSQPHAPSVVARLPKECAPTVKTLVTVRVLPVRVPIFDDYNAEALVDPSGAVTMFLAPPEGYAVSLDGVSF